MGIKIKGSASRTSINVHSQAQGKSAYQVALDNGFVGTEAEWLESLKGADGVSPVLPDNVSAFINDIGYVTTDDERLSDARTPLPHTHQQSDIDGLDTLSSNVSYLMAACEPGVNVDENGDLTFSLVAKGKINIDENGDATIGGVSS